MVSEEKDDNNETMVEGEEGGDGVVWMDWEDEPTDELRYNGEGNKNRCITWEHVEDIFEARNCNTSKVRSKIRNIIAQLNTQAKTTGLSQTTHMKF